MLHGLISSLITFNKNNMNYVHLWDYILSVCSVQEAAVKRTVRVSSAASPSHRSRLCGQFVRGTLSPAPL